MTVRGSGRDAQTRLDRPDPGRLGCSGYICWVLVSPFPFPIHIPPSQLPVSVLGPQELPLLIMVQNGLLVSVGGPVGGWSPRPKNQLEREGERGSVPPDVVGPRRGELAPPAGLPEQTSLVSWMQLRG